MLDLMQVPSFAQQPNVKAALAGLTPLMRVLEIRTEDDWLLVDVQAQPTGIFDSLRALHSTYSR